MRYLQLFLILLLPLQTWSLQSYAFGDKEYNIKYDPARDPFRDLAQAKMDAKAEHKLILIEIGGDWCIWCKRLEKFITENSRIRQSLDEVFIVVKVNVSEENGNAAFLSKFPKTPGYPHFIVVNASGTITEPENTSKFETKNGYSPQAFNAFIKRWKEALQKERQQ